MTVFNQPGFSCGLDAGLWTSPNKVTQLGRQQGIAGMMSNYVYTIPPGGWRVDFDYTVMDILGPVKRYSVDRAHPSHGAMEFVAPNVERMVPSLKAYFIVPVRFGPVPDAMRSCNIYLPDETAKSGVFCLLTFVKISSDSIPKDDPLRKAADTVGLSLKQYMAQTFRNSLDDWTLFEVSYANQDLLKQKYSDDPPPPKAPEAPITAMANLSSNVYTGNAGYGPYVFIGNNCTVPPNTCENVGLAAGAYATADRSQIVVAIRGTVSNGATADERMERLSSIHADASFISSDGTPTSAFAQNVADARAFLRSIQSRYPGAAIVLTGHSLGGAIAQVLGQASNLTTVAFNAPGAGNLYPRLTDELAGLSRTLNSTYSNSNYRIEGDIVSQLGQPIGSTITIPAPSGSLSLKERHAISTVIAGLSSISPTRSQQ
jgi:hypothetical protein